MSAAGGQIASIALEHARLARSIQDVRDAAARGEAWPALATALDRALEELAGHFASEEALMALREYPQLEHHAAQHGAIVERLQKLRRECTQDRHTELFPVLLDLMQSTIAQHEASADAALQHYIASLG